MITAKQIFEWAATGEGQRQLPRLIRRLICTTATTTQIAMPAGDSTATSGWDGEAHSEHGNAWVPVGYSCWEVSCESSATTKANKDYAKRTAQFDREYARKRTYVAVTARKWSTRQKWVEKKRAEGHWGDVRAYDADDIEQWLEQSPALALAFGEELGFSGAGISSLQSFLATWCSQSNPQLTQAAILAGRDSYAVRLLEKCRKAVSADSGQAIPIKGDSAFEAVAFVAACLSQHNELAEVGVVVTDVAGWSFVEKNPQLKIAIAASPEIAEQPPSRAGLAIIVPYASGDMARQFTGVAGRLDDAEVHLERPDFSEFEKALLSLGLDENDSRRVAVLCGRSWSIFRRQHAINPAIRRPLWLDHPNSSSLATLCLVGAWSSQTDADKAVIERISGKSYDALERELRELERVDDSPILHIGTMWKAKSALELLALFGDRITASELDRFFSEAEVVLATPDPQLELPHDKRFAAAIYGKKRPISGLLVESICDTLIKLAVRGPDMAALAALNIQARVDQLIYRLLASADRTRWLSLSSQLPALAEASPRIFLEAVEVSLSAVDAPVRCLLEETDSASGSGSCWHAGLLWALETLAWAPQNLTRVSLILVRLSETTIKGNWGNSPLNSLHDFYRSWFPQTAATLEQRIASLDVLIKRVPDAASNLVDWLVEPGADSASHIARPKWRDDDAGAGYGATAIERHGMLVAASERQIEMAEGHATRIAALIKNYSAFDDQQRSKIIKILSSANCLDDADKETIRQALRRKIYWHRNYDDDKAKLLDNFLLPLEQAYEALLPHDLIIRHGWLFRSNGHSVDLPIRTRDEDYNTRAALIETLRGEALLDIYAQQGWSGFITLAEYAHAGWHVGYTIAKSSIAQREIIDWVMAQAGDLHLGNENTEIVRAFVGVSSRGSAPDILTRLFEEADIVAKPLDWKVRLLILAPEERITWDWADILGADGRDAYWQGCMARLWRRDDDVGEFEFALKQLMGAKRPISALTSCHGQFSKLDTNLVAQMLEGALRGEETDRALPASYYFQEAVDYLEQAPGFDAARLVQIEFGLIKALGLHGEGHAKTLYNAVMSQPELFVELLTLMYKPRNGKDQKSDEGAQNLASMAWSVLRGCTRQPGATDDHRIEPTLFRSFVEKARELAQVQDRLEVCDSHLGQIMAHAPDGADGIFPFEPARDVMDELNSEDIFGGFYSGCINKRGTTSRGVFDGGEQERELANYYRSQSHALEISHPHVADVLSRLAVSYDRHGAMEDLEVRLRRERA